MTFRGKGLCAVGLLAGAMMLASKCEGSGPKGVGSDGVSLGTYTWNAHPEAWEPAANPAVAVGNRQVTRGAHKWADYTPSVAFECQLRDTKVWAVNPVPNEPRPAVTPNVWDNASLANFLGGVLGTFNVQQAVVDGVTDNDIRLYQTTPGCFAVDWSARFKKTGATFSYTPPAGGGPNVLAAQPFVVNLDEDMDDKLMGLVEICCCAWQESIPEAGEGERVGEPFPPDNEIDEETAGRVSEAEDLEDLYGIDWVATKIRDPQTWGDANTEWRGSYEQKSCLYSIVNATLPDGSQSHRRRRNGNYDPSNEAQDADDTDLGGL